MSSGPGSTWDRVLVGSTPVADLSRLAGEAGSNPACPAMPCKKGKAEEAVCFTNNYERVIDGLSGGGPE